MTDGRSGHPGIWLLICVCMTFLILWLALMPADSAPSGLWWDKLNHAVAMAVVTGLAYLSFQSRSWAPAVAFLYGTAFGVLIELLQATLKTGRSAEWSDVVADVIGAGCAWSVIMVFKCRTASEQ